MTNKKIYWVVLLIRQPLLIHTCTHIHTHTHTGMNNFLNFLLIPSTLSLSKKKSHHWKQHLIYMCKLWLKFTPPLNTNSTKRMPLLMEVDEGRQEPRQLFPFVPQIILQQSLCGVTVLELHSFALILPFVCLWTTKTNRKAALSIAAFTINSVLRDPAINDMIHTQGALFKVGPAYGRGDGLRLYGPPVDCGCPNLCVRGTGAAV